MPANCTRHHRCTTTIDLPSTYSSLPPAPPDLFSSFSLPAKASPTPSSLELPPGCSFQATKLNKNKLLTAVNPFDHDPEDRLRHWPVAHAGRHRHDHCQHRRAALARLRRRRPRQAWQARQGDIRLAHALRLGHWLVSQLPRGGRLPRRLVVLLQPLAHRRLPHVLRRRHRARRAHRIRRRFARWQAEARSGLEDDFGPTHGRWRSLLRIHGHRGLPL